MEGVIPAHGGYEELLSFRKARILYDATVFFCGRYLEKRDRTRDQMTQAFLAEGGLRERMTHARLAARKAKR